MIFSDLHEDVPKKKQFTYNLDGVSVFIIHKTSKEQIAFEILIEEDKNKLKKKLIDHGVNENDIVFSTLGSILTSPEQVESFFRKSFKNNK